jgi:hypothetical protein
MLPNKSLEKIVAQKTDIIQKQLTEEIRTDFLKTLGIKAEGNDLMNSVINKFIQQKFDDFITPYRDYIPIVLVLGLYFILQILAFIYVIIIKLIALIIFYILRLTGFVKIKEVAVKAWRAML